MTVNRLSENTVLIVLYTKDMHNLSLDINDDNSGDEAFRKTITKIMKYACAKAGVDICNRKVDIEALPFENECYLLITVHEKIRRSFRKKSTGECVCYSLGGSGNFLDTLERIYRQNICCNKNSAYLYNDNYYIVFDYPNIPKKLKVLLSEYAEKSVDKIESARVKENGRVICADNAIYQIGRHLV